MKKVEQDLVTAVFQLCPRSDKLGRSNRTSGKGVQVSSDSVGMNYRKST